jgi:pimeloyl-ACP methyl ester carboxylesterase
MSERIHRAIAADGTAIAARVHGQGPPVVLVHGGAGDGEVGWRHLLPHLTGDITCYAMSTRGRGLSQDHPDHTLEALTSDVVAIAESVGEPVGLVGWSLGGTIALGAAADSPALSGVAVYEPGVFDVPHRSNPLGDEEKMRAIEQAGATLEPAEVPRRLLADIMTHEERHALEADNAFEAWAPNVPTVLRELPMTLEGLASGGFSPTAPATLASVTVPVLYLHGTRTPSTWYVDGADHLARYVADIRVTPIDDVGHFAPMLAPEPLAAALIRFFSAERRPV